MPALAREALFTACRNIYEMAGEKYALPPLIRDVRNIEAQSGHTYRCSVQGGDLSLNVELDEACADRNVAPFSKLPLRFDVSLRDSTGLAELDESEKNALVRAFLLGARAPIVVEQDVQDQAYKVSLQLSSTYFVCCGELADSGADLTAHQICERVARELYHVSKDFFDSSEEGVAIWIVRAAQDLFGEPKPPPEAFWPSAPAASEQLVAEEVQSLARRPDLVSIERAPARYSRHAAMAATILIGLAGVVMSAQFGVGASPSPEPRKIEERERAFAPSRPNESRRVKYASLVDDLPVFSAAALGLHFDQGFVQGAEGLEKAAPSAALKRPSFEAGSAKLREAAQSVAPVEVRINLDQTPRPAPASQRAIAEDRGKRQGGVKKPKTQLASRSVQPRPESEPQPEADNPLALVGRTVDGFTQNIVKDLRRLHYRFSSLNVR